MSELDQERTIHETPKHGPVGDEIAAFAEEEEELSEAERRVYMASQWTLMARRFKRHKIARVALVIVLLFYFVAVFCEFFAPYDPNNRNAKFIFVPPQRFRIIDAEGSLRWPFVYGLEQQIDMESFRKTYTHNTDQRYPLSFFVKGDTYKLWGAFETDIHFFGVAGGENAKVFLMGTDSMGRDVLSRIIYGSRISLSIGLIGVAISFVLGMLIGGISGFAGGVVDTAIQRIIEVFRSFPKLPLWMALSAALPPHWPQLRIYFAITIVLSFMGWVGLARVVRGKFLSLREEDYVMAAKTSGSSEMRIIWRHLVPAFLSHIIASLTLSIPQMILGETALSFLGIGLRPPLISWGVLLQQAQNARTIALHPWLMLPGIFVIVTILAFNFTGDGLRDAADPYGS